MVEALLTELRSEHCGERGAPPRSDEAGWVTQRVRVKRAVDEPLKSPHPLRCECICLGSLIR